METLFYAIIQLLHSVINMYIWVVIIAAILSLLQLDSRNPIVEVLNRLTQPAFSFVRKKMPFVVFSGIDLSPIVIILGLQFTDTLLLGL